MALGLFVAASVLVTTTSLVLVLSKLNEPESKTINREDENDSTELSESERERIREIFKRETNEMLTLAELRENKAFGYTDYYLWKQFSIENLTTTASLEKVLDLIKLDLAEGVKPAKIAFGCIRYWPKRDVISAVIEKTGANIKDILEYDGINGNNCLTIMFSVLTLHKNRTGQDPAQRPAGTKIMTEIEESVKYLIKLGEEQGLEMKTILKKTTITGRTLFKRATVYAPNLASELLNKGVNVNSIDHNFQTPVFEFKSLHRPLIAAGVNPFALRPDGITQANRWNVSEKLISELKPGLTSDLYYSTVSLPCKDQTCDAYCRQGLPDPWYYNNGQIYDFEESDRIGEGAEGTVFSGDFHGLDAAFKFVEIKNLKLISDTPEIIADLNKRLSEMKNLSKTNGHNILPFYGHIRQQLSAKNVKKLGLGTEVTRYEVFITKQCDYNLTQVKNQSEFNVNKAKNIIDQLVDAQEQLQAAEVSHNDIKPGNILVDCDTQTDCKIYIGDFGQADQLGGTPGWTAADFVVDRVPGKTDMYSFGLVILFVLCETNELFYALRDNFIRTKHKDQSWYKDFLGRPVIKLISRMIKVDPQDRANSDEFRKEWIKIRSKTEIITIKSLKLPQNIDYLCLQGPATPTQLEVVLGGRLDTTLAKTAFTQTHLQGNTCFCWLYSVTSSFHQCMRQRTGKV